MASTRSSGRKSAPGSSSKPTPTESAGKHAVIAALEQVPVRARPLLVGYSGGLDSTVLLHAAIQVFGADAVIAVHVHHGLQAQADEWLDHCRQQAQAWSVSCEAERAAPAPEKPDGGLENWAREARRMAFSRVGARRNAIDLLLAQHADDQIETIVQRLLRGAGSHGLAGMAASSLRDGLWVHRPLLFLRQEVLRAYAGLHQLGFIEDPSNQDLTFLRNRLRHRVLPELERACPGLGNALLRAARHLGQTNRALDALLFDGQGVPEVLDRKCLREANSDVAALMVRAWLRERGLRLPDQNRFAQMLAQLMASDSAYATIEHDGKTIHRYRDRITCEISGEANPPALIEFRWQGEQVVPLPQYGGSLIFEPDSNGVDASRIRGRRISVSALRMSAQMRERLGGPTRAIRLLCQERGIAQRHRRRLPMFCVGDTVLFAAGIGLNAQWLNQSATNAGAVATDRVLLRWLPDRSHE